MSQQVASFALAACLACISPVSLLAHEPRSSAATIADGLSTLSRDAAQTVDLFHAALGRGDTAAALGFLTDDAVIFEEGGAERSRAEYAGHHLAADAEFSAAVPSTRTRRTGGATESTAWIASEGRTTGSFKGRAVDRLTTETMVLRREGSTWKIVHIHWSSRNPPS